METAERFVLPLGTRLTAVRDLPEEIRKRFYHREGDVALTSPRHSSQILSAQAASLVEAFRSPSRIADVVLAYAAANSFDPEETLNESSPLLQSLIDCGFLVREGSADASGMQPELQPGDLIGGYRVVDQVRVLDDAAVYLLRRDGQPVAIKVQRNRSSVVDAAFSREAAILRRLDGGIAPRLIADEIDGQPALVLAWCEGVNAERSANELRDEGRHSLLSLCKEIAFAYAQLHEAGIVHGNVHPRNIIVSRAGRVRLIDFSRSFQPEIAPEPPPRAGVPFYFDPDQARALDEDRVPPPASFQSDQYSVAALLYSLVTGFHYIDFSVDWKRTLRQIAEDPPLPFTDRGLEAWPQLEAILFRGLSKDPGSRFESIRDFLDALVGIAHRAESAPRHIQRAPFDLADTFVRESSPGGSLFEKGVSSGPPSSMVHGSAGIAYALYRLSRSRADTRLLTLSRLWTDRTNMAGEAFFDETKGITRETVSAVSPYHAPSGVELVRALIGHASGDSTLIRRATEDFIETAFTKETKLDLLTGRSGVLLGAAMLLDITSSLPESNSRIREAGQSLMQSIVSELERQPAISTVAPPPNLGIAHGWSGNLYAIMRWCRSGHVALPGMVARRLDELQGLAIDRGRGLCWRWQGHGRTDTAPVAGWCNGSAGFVHLWTLAHEVLGAPRFVELAEGAGWSAWETDEPDRNICCGLAGRAYALLELHRCTGETSWLDRAKRLTAKAVAGISESLEPPFSLYRGTLGVALLQSEIEHGDWDGMPMFGDEGSRMSPG